MDDGTNIFSEGLIVLIAMFAIVFFIGGVLPRIRRRGLTLADLMVCNRSLPLWIGVLTMTATWVGGGYLCGTAEMAFSSGYVWAQAGWGYAASLILGGIFYAKKMRERGYTTMLDPFNDRFGSNAAAVMYVPALIGELFWTGAILTAMGTSFSVIFGLGFNEGIIICAVIAIAYTVIGGMWAVAYTDVFQLVLMTASLILAVCFVLPELGGLDQAMSYYKEIFPIQAEGSFLRGYFPPLDGWRDPSWGNYYWQWWDYGLLFVFGGIPWHCYFQRVLSARSPNIARWLSIGAGFLAFTLVIPPTLLGLSASVADWGALGITVPDPTSITLPYVLRYLAPASIGALGLGGLAAAVMSSVDSSMLAASSMFTWNVFPMIKPNSSDKQLKIVLRITIIVLGAVATLLAIYTKSVYALWALCSDFVYVLLFPALTTTLYFRGTNRYGIYSGIITALILRMGVGIPELGFSPIFPYPMIENGVVLWPFRTFSMVAGFATIILISALTRKYGRKRKDGG